jgi:hypothetical protein
MKRIGFLSLLVIAALALTLAMPVTGAGPKAAAAPAPAVAAVPAVAVAAPTPEAHPHIDEALEAMRSAKHQLETAEHDFGGHRVKAIEHLNQAIREAEMCMSMK